MPTVLTCGIEAAIGASWALDKGRGYVGPPASGELTSWVISKTLPGHR
jgi:hypothetical protein